MPDFRTALVSVRAGLACVAVVLAAETRPAAGQYMIVSSSSAISASSDVNGVPTTQWYAYKAESYQPVLAISRVRELAVASIIYSFEQNERLPSQASLLFPTWVPSPATFHSMGDSDPLPTTINNDVPNGVNSARVSFDFPGAGLFNWEDPDTLLFVDNSDANHGGLGRAAAFMDTHASFLVSYPHVFVPLSKQVMSETPAYIRRGTGPFEPYALSLPAGSVSAAVGTPHSASLTSAGSVSQEVLDVCQAEGFGDSFNSFGSGCAVNVNMVELRLMGPPAATRPVVAYFTFEARLARGTSPLRDSASLTLQASWTPNGGTTTRALGLVVLSGAGLLSTSNVSVTVLRDLTVGEAGYTADGEAKLVRGVVRAVLDLPVNAPVFLQLFHGANWQIELAPGSQPGGYAAAIAETALPATPAVDQVILYAPAGYSFSAADYYGPGDLLRTAIRGDQNLDGVVNGADAAAFDGAFSYSSSSARHVMPDDDELRAFDFDGDGDVDCADNALFRAAWTGGGAPYSAYCQPGSDGDGDGVPDGSDDCAATAPGEAVSAVGCPPGDADASGLVDPADAVEFAACMTGPFAITVPPPLLGPVVTAACRQRFDFDADGDIDLADAGAMLRFVRP